MFQNCRKNPKPEHNDDENNNINVKTEISPLLPTDAAVSSPRDGASVATLTPQQECSILVDIIGARWLPIENMDTFCVVQYGSVKIHQTKPFAPALSRATRLSRALQIHRLFGSIEFDRLLNRSLQNPIWTIKENSLTTFNLRIPKDFRNNKPLTISIWAKPRPMKLRQLEGADINLIGQQICERNKVVFVGKVRLTAPTILKNASQEERIDYPLVDDLGRGLASSSWNDTPVLALRMRVASEADMAFTEHWNHQPRPFSLMSLVKMAQLKMDWHKSTELITEIPENQVIGASIVTALGGALRPTSTKPGQVVVKPYPDPTRKKQTDALFPKQFKTMSRMRSTNWIHAGSKATSLGRIYLEILSCHDLPNVDYGGPLGNQTDAFCSVVYGDSMVQTDIIDDELSPHWLPWTRRAFIMEFQHPSQVLYIAVFGFKRKPMRHKPIGRIEINPANLRHNTTSYNLEYELFRTSHELTRTPRGRIRIRLRMECDHERSLLLAALKPPPSIYINVRQKKSCRVARYTACGEYDNEEKFNIKILQSYIDEILEGFLRRLLYACQDGFWSLVLWKNQSKIFGIGFPLYSMVSFVLGFVAVELPQMIPAILCFGLALLLLALMQQRLDNPSPWRRCSSFNYYFQILCSGKSPKSTSSIKANQGWDEQCVIENKLRRRIDEDKDFFEKKDAIEKEIEGIEQEGEGTKSKGIPLELMIVLGKVQSIVGDICRLLRVIDSVLNWGESYVSFFLTLSLLVLGTVFVFIPWAFLLTWVGRLSVVVFLGPQNKLIDILFYQNHPESIEQRIRKMFEYRMFEARCHHEEVGKRRAFRNLLFGRYATWVPPNMWTPHRDFPLPASTSHANFPRLRIPTELPTVSGQLLKGSMIPRPPKAWEANEKESKTIISEVQQCLKEYIAADDQAVDPALVESTNHKSQYSSEGFEVTDLYDEEAAYVRDVLKEESNRELGVEVLDEKRASSRYLPAYKSLKEVEESDDSSDENQTKAIGRDSSLPESDKPIGLSLTARDSLYDQSTIELGVEISDDMYHDILISEYDDETSETSEDDEEFIEDFQHIMQLESGRPPMRVPEPDRQALFGQSTIELGVEIAEGDSTFVKEMEKATRSKSVPSSGEKTNTTPSTSLHMSSGTKDSSTSVDDPFADKQLVKNKKNVAISNQNKGPPKSPLKITADGSAGRGKVGKGRTGGSAARLRLKASREEAWEDETLNVGDESRTSRQPALDVGHDVTNRSQADEPRANAGAASDENWVTISTDDNEIKQTAHDTGQDSLEDDCKVMNVDKPMEKTQNSRHMVRDASQGLGYEVLDDDEESSSSDQFSGGNHCQRFNPTMVRDASQGSGFEVFDDDGAINSSDQPPIEIHGSDKKETEIRNASQDIGYEVLDV